MTVTKETLKISLTLRTVQRDDKTKTYAVWELFEDDTSKKVTKDYEHSTSAFAALGRLFQKDIAPLVTFKD